MRYIILIFFPLVCMLNACSEKGNRPDAYGNFEAEEITVSAEMAGKVVMMLAVEGREVDAAEVLIAIDSNDLLIKRRQLVAKQRVVASNQGGVAAEVAVMEEQASALQREMKRSKALVLKGAAPQRQYDELESQFEVTQKRIDAIRTRNANIFSELALVDAQIEEVNAQLQKCRVQNPISGTILTSFVKQGEVVSPGRPLYKIARLDSLNLRAYISGSQLSSVKIGQSMKVQFDGASGIDSCRGVLSWVSSEAEFTPKVIQTRDDRVNLVYAIKVRVPNDGSLKIGMPGEIVFEEAPKP
jgi:HlyD family secretion protein